jgi:hypothetical protein
MADIKNFGIKGIASDVQLGKSGGRLKYDTSNTRFDLTASNGSTLEDLRLGSVVAGAWTATAIAPAYGGTGQDFSSGSGFVKFSSGTASLDGTIDLASEVSGSLPVANGGTGSTTAAGGRTNLGLGNLAIQANNAVDIDGGAIDGTTIGANSAGAITGTTVTFGDLSDGAITVTAFQTTLTDSDTIIPTSGAVKDYVDAQVTGQDLDFQADSGGALAIDLDSETLTIAGGTGLSTVGSGNGVTVNLDNTAVTPASYGTTTAIPVLTIDQQGRITAASTAAISTSFTLTDGSNSQTVAGGDTLTVSGTTNEIEAVVSATDTLTIGLPADVTISNDLTVTNDLTVSGTFTSDDITSATVSVSGDAIITGNLTVQGTRTIVNSVTTETADAIFRVNSNGANTDAGFEANANGTIKQILYTAAGTEWDFGSENVKATSFEGSLTGNADTATVLATTRAIGGVNFNGSADITLPGVNAVGNQNTTGSAATLTTPRTISATGDATWTSGNFDGSANATGALTLATVNSNVGEFGSTTEIPVLTVNAKGLVTAASEVSIATSLVIQSDDAANNTVALATDTLKLLGGTNITSTNTADEVTFNLNSTLSGLTAVTASGAITGGSLTDGTATLTGGALTGMTGALTTTGTVTGATLTDGTLSINSGAITSATTGSFSGAVTAGSLTDGTATLSSGALSGATTGSFSGAVTAGTLTDGTFSVTSGAITGATNITASGTITDGTMSIASGAITGATNITASGTVQYGSLSDGSITITGFVDEDNMASDSAVLIPTQQSVKAYVDSQVGGTDLDFQGDSGGALSIDLDSETLDIAGGTNITTVGSGNELTVNLDATLTGLTSVTSTTLTDGTATMTGGALTGVTDVTTSGNMIVGGNLTVSGTTTSVNSTNTTIADTLVVLQSGLTGANPNDIGHIYERGTDGNNGFFGWDQSTERFMAATTTADGSTAGDLTLTAAGFEAGAITATGLTASGVVSFGTLTDAGESIAITKFVDEADGISSNDNDTSVPTSAAVIDYVENNGGDGLLLRATVTSGATTADIGTMPNVSSRTYYAEKLVFKVGTAFAGNNFNYVLVKENGGSGSTVVAKIDADFATTGSYIVELDGDDALTKNATVQVQFFDASDNAVAPTSGSAVCSVHYNWV